MKTYSAKPTEIEKKWILIDAEGLVVGRLVSIIALRLRGKHKVTYTPHMDCGDNVIVINADKIRFTGNKLKGKIYYRHTGYAGGIKGAPLAPLCAASSPSAFWRRRLSAWCRGPLGRRQMDNLRVYPGAAHPHERRSSRWCWTSPR